MTLPTMFTSGLQTVGLILAAMAVVGLLETILPLHPRGRWHRFHLAPNLALTFLTFATNLVFNTALLLALARSGADRFGLVPWLAIPGVLAPALSVVLLDLSFYVAHVTMHAFPLFWRFHRVHHSDATVDVTTTIRQHPGESVIRYLFLAAAAIGLGVSPAAFGVYRIWSVLNGLLEHANLRVPQRLDSFLSLLVVTPNFHKIHHSRAAIETDTNFGNMFSLFDRVFGTYTPSRRGVRIAYGLAEFDDPAVQTTAGLLAMPFRDGAPGASAAAAIAP